MADSRPLWRQIGSKALEAVRVYVNNRNSPLYREWYYRHRPDLASFHNKHRGEDCFIIGNGPSLNEMDLSPLADYHTFGLNKIYLMEERGVDLDLSYLVSVNPLVIEQSADVFEHLDCDTFLSYCAARDHVRRRPHVHYLFTGGPYTFQTDLRTRVHEGYTVTFVAMQIAYFMGFRRVFLIGVDHSFQAEGAPNEKQHLEGADPNHFDPDYFADSEWHLPDLEASELSYHMARYFYRKDGRQIVDATVGGQLDVYPKTPYATALRECKPISVPA